MRKLLYLLFLFLLVISLASCKKDVEPIDVTVEVVSEVIISNQIEVHVVVPIELSSMAELYEITLNVASQTYEKHFEMIGTDQYTMTLMLYQSSAEYASDNASYGQFEFLINSSITTPGLSLGADDLIFE
ncbi:MAG: hypothetical protein ABH890_06600 [Bacillota bacterium]